MNIAQMCYCVMVVFCELWESSKMMYSNEHCTDVLLCYGSVLCDVGEQQDYV